MFAQFCSIHLYCAPNIYFQCYEGGGGGGGERRCFIKDQILNLIAFISVIIESYFSNIVKMKRVLCTQS